MVNVQEKLMKRGCFALRFEMTFQNSIYDMHRATTSIVKYYCQDLTLDNWCI